MPNKTPKRILAIASGTREMGVAVLEDGSLIYFGVKNLKQGKLPQRVLKCGSQIVERLMDEYEPQVLALEKTSYPGSKRSPLLDSFSRQIKATARKRGMKAAEYAPRLIREMVCAKGRLTKKKTARVVADSFPELKKYLIEPKWYRDRQRERYWMKLFDAVAVGVACYRQNGGEHKLEKI